MGSIGNCYKGRSISAIGYKPLKQSNEKYSQYAVEFSCYQFFDKRIAPALRRSDRAR